MAVELKKGRALAALNITPLIDVVFLLLIFFLVATRFAEEDLEMDFPMPTASEAMPMVIEPKEIFVNIDRTGKIHFNGGIVTEQQLEGHLRTAKSANPLTQSVIIRADKRVELQPAVSVMNLCKKVGIESYSITIDGES